MIHATGQTAADAHAQAHAKERILPIALGYVLLIGSTKVILLTEQADRQTEADTTGNCAQEGLHK